MEIALYHSWGELIYHLFRTDLLRSIFNLFSTVSFETLSSLWCNNASRIVSLSPEGQHLSIYPAVTLTSYMVRNLNVNVNVDLYFTLSFELVGRLPNLKHWKLSTANISSHWRGARWSKKCQLWRCTNQWWGAEARNSQTRRSRTVICWHRWLLPRHRCFYDFRKLSHFAKLMT